MKKGLTAAEWVDAEKLKPWDKNPRKNQPVREVAESIKRFGWGSVILAHKDGTIVAGHTRLLAHQTLVASLRNGTNGWHPDAVRSASANAVPVRYGDWSERDAELLAIADNKLSEKAEWSPGLADLLSEFSLSEVELAGFDYNELGKLGGGDKDESQDSGQAVGADLQYKVVVACADEAEQAELLERLEAEGMKCQPLIS